MVLVLTPLKKFLFKITNICIELTIQSVIFPRCFYLFKTHYIFISITRNLTFLPYYFHKLSINQFSNYEHSQEFLFIFYYPLINLLALVNLFTPKSLSNSNILCLRPNLISLFALGHFYLIVPPSNLNLKYLEVNLSLFLLSQLFSSVLCVLSPQLETLPIWSLLYHMPQN